VRLLPPDKASKILKVGEFTRAKVIAAEGHDLIAMPV
jgi:ribosomal protein S12 methylthiotransferase